MKKLLVVVILLFLVLLGWTKRENVRDFLGMGDSFGFTGFSGTSEEEELSFPERINRVADELLQPLTEQTVDRTQELALLYEEGRSLFQDGKLSREEAFRVNRAIKLLQELQLTRHNYQAEYRRLQQSNFAVIDQSSTVTPEQKRRHFRENQQRLWQVNVNDAMPVLRPALEGVGKSQ